MEQIAVLEQVAPVTIVWYKRQQRAILVFGALWVIQAISRIYPHFQEKGTIKWIDLVFLVLATGLLVFSRYSINMTFKNWRLVRDTPLRAHVDGEKIVCEFGKDMNKEFSFDGVQRIVFGKYQVALEYANATETILVDRFDSENSRKFKAAIRDFAAVKGIEVVAG